MGQGGADGGYVTVISARILDSGTVSVACVHLHLDVRDRAHDCIREFASAPPTDGHDQATFTTAWEPYIRARGDPEALAFVGETARQLVDAAEHLGDWVPEPSEARWANSTSRWSLLRQPIHKTTQSSEGCRRLRLRGALGAGQRRCPITYLMLHWRFGTALLRPLQDERYLQS